MLLTLTYILQFAAKLWGVVTSQHYISFPVSATLLRYVAVTLVGSDAEDNVWSANAREDGYVVIVNSNGKTSNGSAFYIAIAK